MKFIVEQLKNLRELYLNQLQMLLSAEEQIANASLDMIQSASDQQLKGALETHRCETEKHVQRLEQILTAATGSAKRVKCKAAHGLIVETDDMLLDTRNEAVRDVALIAAAQRIEHFEIAAYGAVRRFAQILGDSAAAALLTQTIDEEGNADRVLSAIAERLNLDAKQAATCPVLLRSAPSRPPAMTVRIRRRAIAGQCNSVGMFFSLRNTTTGSHCGAAMRPAITAPTTMTSKSPFIPVVLCPLSVPGLLKPHRDFGRVFVPLSLQPTADLRCPWFSLPAAQSDGAPRCFALARRCAIASTGTCAKPTNVARAPELLRALAKLGETAYGLRLIALFHNRGQHSCGFPLSPGRVLAAATEFLPAWLCSSQLRLLAVGSAPHASPHEHVRSLHGRILLRPSRETFLLEGPFLRAQVFVFPA
jgi:ferritin-like metal-binding protein YciE